MLAYHMSQILRVPRGRVYGRRGRLSVSRYLRVGLTYGEPDIFELRVREEPPTESALFSLLIDDSGSMCGRKVHESVKAAYVVARALEEAAKAYLATLTGRRCGP